MANETMKNNTPTEWKKEYNVGVDYIDNAHKKLFGVLRKTIQLISDEDYEKNKHACIEAIKFLQNYTATHFEQEEGYQRSINYKGYETHKKLHDNLRYTVLPHLAHELDIADYGRESIEEFLAIFAGWLAGHILIEDRAITGKTISRWSIDEKRIVGHEEIQNTIDGELKSFFHDLFSMEMNLINRHFEGLNCKESFICELTFNDKVRIIMAGENKLVVKMARVLLGSTNSRFDKQAVTAYAQLLETLGKGALAIVNPKEEYLLTKKRAIEESTMKEIFNEGYPEYSMEWSSKEGRFALGIILE